jgi:Protein of unknown function (DUF3606)
LNQDGAAFGRPFTIDIGKHWPPERLTSDLVDRTTGNAAMQRIKHPPMRNKIDLADPRQLRAWTRRLRIPPDLLQDVVGKVGNSATAVTKEIELRRNGRQPCPLLAPPSAAPNASADGEWVTPV